MAYYNPPPYNWAGSSPTYSKYQRFLVNAQIGSTNEKGQLFVATSGYGVDHLIIYTWNPKQPSFNGWMFGEFQPFFNKSLEASN